MEDVDQFESPEGVGVGEKVENVEKKRRNPLKFVLMFLLFLFISIIGFGVYEYFRIKPRDVRFTNVTSSSVTVSWNTKSPTSGTALVFEGDTWLPMTVLGLGGERFYDTRDVRVAELRAVQETSTNLFNDEELGVSMEDISTEIEVVNMGEYYTHHVTISGLDSEKEYSFMIGDSFLYTKANDVDGISAVETLAVPNSVEAPIPAYGSIKDAQNSEDPEMLAPVYDGIVYLNLMDELSGNRSNVYSGALNADGNWYIDISGIRVEEGEDFLSGEVIANVVGEIMIDAGPDGKWEGEIISDVIAPAEMIVINDPLQRQIEGVGIKKVESNVLGDFTFDTEAAGCTFAGYCGPCYDGVLTNPCSCPQDILNSRPGCKGQEDGTTMEQAIAGVVRQTSKAMGGCSNNGEPGAHVYFDNACRECRWDTAKGGYLWTTSGVSDSDCVADKTGRIIQPKVTDVVSECSPDTSQSLIKVGSRCCRDGQVGVGRMRTVPATIMGVSDGLESVKSAIDTAPRTIYCDISGMSELELCSIPNGSGKKTANGCSAYACKEGYELSFNGISERPLMVCIKDEGEIVIPPVSKCNTGDTGKICGGEYSTVISRPIFHYCTDENTCVEDGGTCYIQNSYSYTTTGAYYKGECVPPRSDVITDDTDDLVGIENINIYSDSSCWKGASRGYYRILSDGSLQRCTNSGVWIDKPSSTGSKRCQDLYDLGSIGGVNCNLKGDFCSIHKEGDVYEDYYCDGAKWREWSSYKEENPQTNVPAGSSLILSKGGECSGAGCVCPGNLRIDEGEYCPEVDLMACDYSNLGKICNESGYICRESSQDKSLDTELDARKYYIQGGKGTVCVRENNKCYRGVNSKNELLFASQGAGVFCLPNDSPSSTFLKRDSNIEAFNLLKTNYVSRVLGLGNDIDSLDFIIDSETGMVFDIDPGSYLIEYEGEYFTFEVRDYQLEGNDGSVLIYLDKNDNGEYDEGVDIKVSDIASKIKILTLSKTYNYELKKGFNFVTCPFLIKNEDSQSAASLLRNLNDIYGDSLFSISKYEGGRWKIVGQNTVVYGNNDFQLLPGEGYVIKAKEEITVSVIGQPVKYDTVADSVPITLFEGWNLIGLYGTGVKTYTAKTMIADINASNFTADNVSKWEKEKQSYEGFQFSQGQEYGFDFPINSLESYFVRILEGRGNWQPKLGSQ